MIDKPITLGFLAFRNISFCGGKRTGQPKSEHSEE